MKKKLRREDRGASAQGTMRRRGEKSRMSEWHHKVTGKRNLLSVLNFGKKRAPIQLPAFVARWMAIDDDFEQLRVQCDGRRDYDPQESMQLKECPVQPLIRFGLVFLVFIVIRIRSERLELYAVVFFALLHFRHLSYLRPSRARSSARARAATEKANLLA